MPSQPAYSRLQVDQRRQQLLDAGSHVFAEHAFEEITMREIATAAGVSKALLYHYFPSKAALFAAAVHEKTRELEEVLEPVAGLAPLEALTASLRRYLDWIEQNERLWVKLMQSAATVPEARAAVEQFRDATRERILTELTGTPTPAPALRAALAGWLGSADATILDWVDHKDLTRDQLTTLLAATFAAALLAAQQADPELTLNVA